MEGTARGSRVCALSASSAVDAIDAVDVVIVSFNTLDLTLRCVENAFLDASVATVCVVDNASSDGSLDALCLWARIQLGQPQKLRVEPLTSNRGFGAANNHGFSVTTAPFIALVNSDAFVGDRALEVLRNYLQAHPSVGVVGPRLLNRDATFQESRYPFPSPARAWADNLGISGLLQKLGAIKALKAGAVDWLSGACLMVRREVWQQTQGFDENFFLYAEETDWQFRINKAGWEIHWVPEASVTHLGGESGGNQKEAVREWFFQGADRYFLKHHGLFGVFSLRLATTAGAALRWARQCILPGGRPDHAAWIFRRQTTSALPRVEARPPPLNRGGA